MEVELVRIKEELLALIDEYFQDSLREYARTFLDDKLEEGTHFGLLTVFHYRMFGGEGELIYKAAAAIELFVLSCDMFDDIQDQDAPSKPWMQIPQPLAINVALGFMVLGHQCIGNSSLDHERIRIVTDQVDRLLLKSINGQMMDLQNDVADSDGYTNMITMKSASILVMACMAGVLLATGAWNETVANYATEMGLGAQLYNDYRNMLRWHESSDIISGRRTLPILLMSEELEKARLVSSEGSNPLALYLSEHENTEEIVALLDQSGVGKYIQVLLKLNYYQCLEYFDSLSPTPLLRQQFIDSFVQQTELVY
ncbi:polyprenyl synthetase family protein [Paenibacillus sp. ACRRX]|uniref:polyprenyl synthetase family protein n=1 Tax=Paenibacillus sp. ACRRX TaxID=2918206 RepID=UPI001EF533E1|nr:polyprenyl synthetase family protein [Paenibacillus sp. ACRRX]MCG7409707.1 polyprenyl synthetase family protein [Paenibacillus sp. ACRRX]